jgi:hypothetical protein
MKWISKYHCTFLLVVVLLLACSIGRAQHQYSFSLKILNNVDSTPIASMNIIIANQQGKRLQGLLTDINGRIQFRIDDSLCNKLYVHINSKEFESYSSSAITCSDNMKEGNVFLQPVTKLLGEVRVVQRQVIKSGEKLLYQVKHDKFSSAVAGSDILKKLPGVTFVSGSVKLNGRDGVLILIDGKGEQANQQEQLSTLSSLSLNDIIKIEIMSSPSARYEAHIKSVINVITRKSKSLSTIKAGYSQLLYPQKNNFGSSYISGTASSNFNFKINDIRTTLSLGIGNNRSIENSNTDVAVVNEFKYGWFNESSRSHFGIQSNLGLDYDIDSSSSLGLTFAMNLRPSLSNNSSERYDFFNYLSNELDSSKLFSRRYNDDRKSIRFTTQYKYTINKRKNSLLYLNLIHSVNPFNFSNHSVLLDNVNGSDAENTLVHFSSKTNISNASIILTDLLKKPFLSTEVGSKFNILRSNSIQDIESSRNYFDYMEKLYSLFVTTKWKVKKLIMLAEVRGELLDSKANTYYEVNSKQTFENRYFKVYPHLLLQWNVNSDWSASIDYNKRIRRPLASDLNPAARFNGVLQRIVGNPNFQPTYFDKIEAQVQYKNLIVTPYLETMRNRRILVPENDAFELVSRNYGKQLVLGVSASYGLAISKFFTANLSAVYRYTYNQSAAITIMFKEWNHLFLNASAELTPAKNTRLQIDLYYQPPMRLEYSVFKTFFASSLTLRQLLVKDKFSLNFSVTDPIGVEKNQYDIFYPTQTGKYRMRNNNRSISLQLVYNFPFGQKFKKQIYKNKDDGEIRIE